MRQKVVVFSQIDSIILQKLKDRYEVVSIDPKAGDVNQQILKEVADADGMIGAGRLLNESNLKSAKQLKVISTVSVGYDNYDLNYLNQQKIWLANTPHVLTETTADLAFTLLMSAARQVTHLDAWTKQGLWKRTVGSAQFGLDIYGKNLGIIGLGNIGLAIAKRGFHGFNMNIQYHSRSPKPEIAGLVNAEYLELDELLETSDFIVVAVDLNHESAALIGHDQFNKMKPSAVFVNISRGSVVDENALIEALKQNKIFAAGLDVYQQEPLQASALFELDNVVTLPHVGSATAETRFKMAELSYLNLVQALEGETPKCLINERFS